LVVKANETLIGLEKIAKKGDEAKAILDSHTTSIVWTYPEKI